MSAPRQRKAVGGVLTSGPMKKGQKRFAPGTRVTFKLWQGGVVDFKGEVIADGKKLVWVKTSLDYVIEVRREALTVVKEGGK